MTYHLAFVASGVVVVFAGTALARYGPAGGIAVPPAIPAIS